LPFELQYKRAVGGSQLKRYISEETYLVLSHQPIRRTDVTERAEQWWKRL